MTYHRTFSKEMSVIYHIILPDHKYVLYMTKHCFRKLYHRKLFKENSVLYSKEIFLKKNVKKICLKNIQLYIT